MALLLPLSWVGPAACGDDGPADVVRKTIGPQGGLLSSHDEVLTIVLQPGALSSEVEIEVFPSDEPPPIFGPAYRVRPHVELMVDAEITYRRVLPSNANAAVVAAIRWDDYTSEMGYWQPLPRLAVRPEQQVVIGSDGELSLYYGLLEDSDAPPLPEDETTTDSPPDDDGTTSTGPMPGSTDEGSTTAAVDPTTSGSTSGPGTMSVSSSDGPGSTSSGMDTGMGTSSDDGMGMPMCADGVPQAGELCLTVGADYAAGLDPSAVGLADFNGDGALDVATLDLGALEVGLLFGNGDGTLGPPGMGTAVGGVPVGLQVGDFTGEGLVDVALIDAAAGTVLVLAGNGAGVLAAPAATAAGMGPVDLARGDFDGNAALDLTVLDATGGVVQILLGGAGGLTAGLSAPVGMGYEACVANGSFNPGGDAFIDLVAVGTMGYHAWANDGTGQGSLGNIAGAFGAGGTFVDVEAGDIDGDGNDDVAAIDVAGDALVVGLSTGGVANFVFGGPVAVGTDPSDLVLADLDGDGDLDAVVSNATSNDVMVLAWNAGAYGVAFTFPTGMAPSGVAVGQLDGDGVPDLVIANAGSDTVTVVLSDP